MGGDSVSRGCSGRLRTDRILLWGAKMVIGFAESLIVLWCFWLCGWICVCLVLSVDSSLFFGVSLVLWGVCVVCCCVVVCSRVVWCVCVCGDVLMGCCGLWCASWAGVLRGSWYWRGVLVWRGALLRLHGAWRLHVLGYSGGGSVSHVAPCCAGVVCFAGLALDVWYVARCGPTRVKE